VFGQIYFSVVYESVILLQCTYHPEKHPCTGLVASGGESMYPSFEVEMIINKDSVKLLPFDANVGQQ